MYIFFIIIIIILIGLQILSLYHINKYRTYKHSYLASFSSNWKLPEIDIRDLHPVFIPGNLGTKIETEISFLGSISVLGGTSDTETWILSVLAKEYKTMFEFGTCTGKTTYLWAKNSAPDAKIYTLTLSPNEVNTYKPAQGDYDKAWQDALDESTNTVFYYTGTDVESKITQLYGDSKKFDENPYLGICDLIFIDGSHAYSYIKSDTEKALKMLKNGGIILWHDYRGPASEAKDVYRYLNELSNDLNIKHVKDTSFVYYRKDK